MATEPHIDLPSLSEDHNDHRGLIENHVKEVIEGIAEDNILVKKYYKSANEQIYVDCLNLIQSGVPAWLLRTTKVETSQYNPAEKGDSDTGRVEIINAVPVSIEKGIRNVDRYAYTMEVLVREALRSNPVESLPRNTRRPFVYLGNRDIFRDDDIDIILSEFNVEYVEV